MADKKPQYAPPASQVDLEERLANGNESSRVLSTSDSYKADEGSDEGRSYLVKGNDVTEYIGTSPEYATYANKTEAPLATDGDDNPETQVFDEFAASPLPATLRVEGNVEYEGEKDSKKAADEASADSADEEESIPEPAADPSGS